MISSDQIRAARALLNLSQSELAERSGVSVPTVKRSEGSGKIAPAQKSLNAICSALENENIEFIAENGGGAGVRLRKK